jgi:hypothetical protein
MSDQSKSEKLPHKKLEVPNESRSYMRGRGVWKNYFILGVKKYFKKS